MALTFNGWDDSWGVTWGAREFDPNAMAGAAGFVFSSIGVLTDAGLIGVRSQVYGSGGIKGKARFYSPDPDEFTDLQKDDQDALDFVVTLITKGFFDGFNT